MKTGGWGGHWVALERPKPPAVPCRYDFWRYLPDDLSPRCSWWLRQIEVGWRPNRYIRRMGYDESAEWYGVYIAEYLHVIEPALSRRWANRSVFPDTPY